MADKILKIKIQSELSGEQALSTYSNLLKSTDTNLKTLTSTFNGIGENGLANYQHQLTLTSESLKKLQQAQKDLTKASPGTTTSNAISSNVSSDAAKASQQLARQKQQELDAENRIDAQIIAANIATQKRLEEIKQQERLANQRIDAQILQDAINNQKRLEEARLARRANSTNIYRQETSNIVSELNNRLALEQSIRVNGASHIRTIELRSAQEQEAIRANLAARLRQIEESVASGGTNRGAAAAQRTAAINQASAQITTNRVTLEGAQIAARNAAELNRVAQASNNAATAHTNLVVRIAEVFGAYKLLNTTLGLVKQSLLNIPQAGIEQQVTKSSILGIFGTEEGTKNLQFLVDISQKAGQNLLTLEQSYRRFAPAAALAGASQEDINKSFKDFSEVGTILHLTQDKVNSLFLALDQIYSKGVVQSEEIKKQLGNVLPGAVEIGAQAFGKSPAAFLEAMKKNEVIAKDFIPKFAALYRKIFGGENDKVFTLVSDQLLSNTQRVTNQYTELNRQLFKSSEELLNNIVRTTGSALKIINENLSGILQVAGVLAGVLATRLVVALTAITASALTTAAANITLAGSYTAISYAQGRVVQGAVVTGTIANQLVAILAGFGAIVGPTTLIVGSLGLISAAVLKAGNATVEHARLVGETKQRVDELMKLYATGGFVQQEAAANELQAIARIQDASNSYLIEFKGQQIEISSLLEALWDNIKISGKAVWASFTDGARELYNKIANIASSVANAVQSMADTVKNIFTNLISSIYGQLNGLREFITSLGKDATSLNFNGSIERALSAGSKANELYKKSADDFFTTISEGGSKIAKSIVNNAASPINGLVSTIGKTASGTIDEIFNKASKIQQDKTKKKLTLDSLNFTKPTDIGLGNLSDEAKQTAAERKAAAKQQKDLYKDIERDSKFASEAIKQDLDSQTFKYQQNIIGIEEYYNKKTELREKDLANQLEANAKEQAIAAKSGDTAKVEQLKDKAKELTQITASNSGTQDNRAKIIDLQNYKKVLDEIKASSLEAQGDLVSAANIRIDLKYLDERKKLIANGNLEAIKQLDISKAYEKSKAVISALQEKESRASAILQDGENRINILRQAGFITQKQAFDQLNLLRNTYLAKEDDIIAALEKEFALNKGNLIVEQALLDAKAKKAALASQGAGYNNSLVNSTPEKQDRDIEQLKIAQSKDAADYVANQTITNQTDLQTQLAANEANFRKASLFNELKYNQAKFAIASDTALGLTNVLVQMYGRQSTAAKIAFIAYKAYKVAEIALATPGIVSSAYQRGLDLPYGFVFAPVFAATAAAFQAAQVAQVVSAPLPAAHGGLTSVPKEQTYLLDKGERVLSPNQNRDLTQYITNNNNSSNGSSQSASPNIRIINSVDPEVFSEYLGSDSGEKVVMNIVRRNRG